MPENLTIAVPLVASMVAGLWFGLYLGQKLPKSPPGTPWYDPTRWFLSWARFMLLPMCVIMVSLPVAGVMRIIEVFLDE